MEFTARGETYKLVSSPCICTMDVNEKIFDSFGRKEDNLFCVPGVSSQGTNRIGDGRGDGGGWGEVKETRHADR